MITGLNHMSFTVSNLDNSIAFYEKVLGLETISKATRDRDFSQDVTGVENAEMNIAYVKVPNGFIELIEYVNGKGKKLDTTTCNIGSAHICFNVKEFEQWMEHLRKNNVKFRGKVCKVPAGPNQGKSVCYCEDIDGNTIEFIEEIKEG